MTAPIFDDPRKALRFALNHRLQMPRPAMNKAPAGNSGLQKLELADGSHVLVSKASTRPKRNENLAGMDGVAQAGFILYHLARLPEPQQLVLIAQSVPVALPCACRAPCCSGERPNDPWVHAILLICDYLRDEAQLSRIKGKKGMSTGPYLRRALVEKFFVPGRSRTTEEIAKKADVSETTVVMHRKPIVTWLEKNENEGWRSFAHHLDVAGIVGTLETA
jgi:hypothetical protein